MLHSLYEKVRILGGDCRVALAANAFWAGLNLFVGIHQDSLLNYAVALFNGGCCCFILYVFMCLHMESQPCGGSGSRPASEGP